MNPILMAVAPFLIILLGGCATGPKTHVELRGDPDGPAYYQFEDVLWRDQPEGVEFVGYGIEPFYNSPDSIGYHPNWPISGSVFYRMHVAPESAGHYAITLLGPATELGPGDNEILTGTADNAQLQSPDEKTRRLTISDVLMHSRNKPKMKFYLSGEIIAHSASDKQFEKELGQFNTEKGYRRP